MSWFFIKVIAVNRERNTHETVGVICNAILTVSWKINFTLDFIWKALTRRLEDKKIVFLTNMINPNIRSISVYKTDMSTDYMAKKEFIHYSQREQWINIFK